MPSELTHHTCQAAPWRDRSLDIGMPCYTCGETITQTKAEADADSNRLYALDHDVTCAECGHLYPMNMLEVCECCRKARDLFLEHGEDGSR